MRAAHLVAPGRVTVEDVDVPVRGDSTVLIRTRLASICGSDLHSVFGERTSVFPCMPGYPGHESVGEVIESRSDAFAPGDWVLAVPEPDESTAFAEYQSITDGFLVSLPPGADITAMVMAQQLGTVIFALKRMWPDPPADVATVIGAGSAGLHFTQLLKQRGFGQVIVSDLSEARLRMAKELGADMTVSGSEDSVVDATMDRTQGRGADLVIEAAGYDATRAQAIGAVRERGRVGLFGLPERSGDAVYPFQDLFDRQPSVELAHGSQHEPGLVSFREALDEIRSGRLQAAGLVTHTCDLADINHALELAHYRRDDAVKVCLSFNRRTT